jgi:aspartyl-tRNA(Asn)/glutamyl-tRNA(Gln) amidotransferase subunit A
VAEFFSKYDYAVTANFLSTAPSVDGDLNESLSYGDPAGAIGNGCGLPAIALPIEPGKDGMPLSMQIMAGPFEEARLIEMGELWQSRTRFHKRRPTMAQPAGAR